LARGDTPEIEVIGRCIRSTERKAPQSFEPHVPHTMGIVAIAVARSEHDESRPEQTSLEQSPPRSAKLFPVGVGDANNNGGRSVVAALSANEPGSVEHRLEASHLSVLLKARQRLAETA
jgi:hypothetical protein